MILFNARRSLQQRFARWGLLPRTAMAIAAAAVVVGMASIFLVAIVTHNRATDHARADLGDLLDAVENTVRVACFVQDRALASEVAKGLMKNSKLLAVAIRSGSETLATMTRNGEVPDTSDGRIVRRVYSPFDVKQQVGELVLHPDPAVVQARVANDVSFVSSLLGLQWLALGLVLLLLVMLYVVRPIKVISDRLHGMDAESGKKLRPPSGQEHSEIGRLVSDINLLAGRLVAAIHDREERSKQLQAAKMQVDAQARQLKEQNAALARAIQVREEVERIARHDLKAPLNSIALIPAILRRKRKMTFAEEELLQLIEVSAHRVLRMASLSLDIFRMEVGDYAFKPEQLDVARLVSAVVRDLEGEATAKGVRWLVKTPEKVVAYAEEVLCYSILANLLKNAVEASSYGETVSVVVTAGSTVVIEIHNCAAVPLAIRESFFEKYSTYGKDHGTGLGTYSAQLMATVQRGSLMMSTSESTGTTMRLELLSGQSAECECGKPNSNVEQDRFPQDIRPARVLMVDDDGVNTQLMLKLLPSPPLSVTVAAHGRIAIELCQQQRFDFIFMDLEMPVMGGFEALKRIRRLQRQRGEAPSVIFAYSAHDDDASRERSLAAGFDDHISKPSSASRLLSVMRGCCSGSQGQTIGDQAAAETTVWIEEELLPLVPQFLSSRRALVVDLRTALERGAKDEFLRTAHKMKGSMAIYGFSWGVELCRRLEEACHHGEVQLMELIVDALNHYLVSVVIRVRGTRSTSEV